MQKPKLHILSTRLLDEATIDRAADLNIEVVSTSFISVQPVYSDELRNSLQSLATQSLYVVFTSANAVASVVAQAGDKVNWKIFCTSGKTKEHAAAVFGEETIVATSKNAGLLAERIIASERIVKVTFFCGDQRLNDLPDKLKAANIQTDEVIVYTTVQTPVLIEEKYDGFLFFSPSAVHSFFSMNTVPVDVVLFSIGDTTTTAIQSYCANKTITSDRPAIDDFLKKVANWYHISSHQVD